MDPLGKLSLELLHSGFWGFPYAICLLGMAAACWVGCYRIPQEIFVSKPAQIAAWLVLLFMCIVVIAVNSATPPQVKNAMAKDDLLMLMAYWENGNRAAVEKWLSNPPKKFYEE
jgi:hypothetical protein